MVRAGTGRLGRVAVLCFVAGALLLVVCAATVGGGGSVSAMESLLVCMPAFALGLVLMRARPESPTGPALVGLAAAPCLAMGIEAWAATAAAENPLPGASPAAALEAGVWVLNLAGFVMVCLTFPDNVPLDGVSRAVAHGYVAAAVAVVIILGVQQVVFGDGGVPVLLTLASVVVGVGLVAVLVAAVAVLARRYRSGGQVLREQMRWLFLGCVSVPVLLVVGWLAQTLGAPVWVAYLGFMLAMLVVVPASIAVAVLRHDLLDIDRLLSESVSWLLTTVLSAAVFAGIVLLGAQVGAWVTGSSSAVAVAAFGTALALLPTHRVLQRTVGRVVDPDTYVARRAVTDFVQSVQAGQREPEDVEAVLRGCLGDPDVRVLIARPDGPGLVTLAGASAAIEEGPGVVALRSRDAQIGVIVLARPSARRVRLTRELAVEARLPLEVSRLRLGLRDALDDARESRARLVETSTVERRRLERDLHDGIQPRLLAVGMNLRSLQRATTPGDPVHAGLDSAVAALEQTVTELRRLAHGLRPTALDDGLEHAVRNLVCHSAIPIDLDLAPVDLSEVRAVTAYYVIAEALSNTFKHARATSARVSVSARTDRIAVEVRDDGRGGAHEGTGLTNLRDRVAALGGHLELVSPAGAGTTVRAVI